VLSQIGRSTIPVQSSLKPEFLLTSLCLSLSLSASNFYPASAQKQASNINTPNHSLAVTPSPPPTASNTLANGVYLYGQSAKPNQIQQEYFLFELNDNQVTGAFYMPRSSFDCFRGQLKAGELQLTVINSYDEATYPYAVKLQAYKPVAPISSNDQRILQTCKAAR